MFRKCLAAWMFLGALGVVASLGGCGPEPAPDFWVLQLLVQHDTDEDGRLAPGERATLVMIYENRGSEAGRTGRCDLTTSSPGVSLGSGESASMSFEGCAIDERCRSSFTVEVERSVAPGTVLTFLCRDPNNDEEVEEDGIYNFDLEVLVQLPEVNLRLAELVVLDDTDRDGVLNPGETARLAVDLLNQGPSALTPSRCTVGGLTPGVVVDRAAGSLELRLCRAGERCEPQDFRVQVSPEVPPGTLARFTCTLLDTAERNWPLDLAVAIEAPAARPRLDGLTLLDEGDGDGVLAPGESARLQVRLQNIGVAALPPAGCTITSPVPWLTLPAGQDRLEFAHCAADTDCGEREIRLHVSSEAPRGATTTLLCHLVDVRGWSYPVPLAIPLTLAP